MCNGNIPLQAQIFDPNGVSLKKKNLFFLLRISKVLHKLGHTEIQHQASNKMHTSG